VDPRVGLDDVEKRKFLALPALELPPLGLPARSQSLYQLRYPGSLGANKREQNTVRSKFTSEIKNINEVYCFTVSRRKYENSSLLPWCSFMGSKKLT
jgi:hypothetical protein